MVIGGCYSLWLFNRISYGNLKTQYIKQFLDISKKEFFIFFPLVLGTIVMGLYPSVFLDVMHSSVNSLVESMNF
jgi:NADH-quinone oxidoreductase subunit M